MLERIKEMFSPPKVRNSKEEPSQYKLFTAVLESVVSYRIGKVTWEYDSPDPIADLNSGHPVFIKYHGVQYEVITMGGSPVDIRKCKKEEVSSTKNRPSYFFARSEVSKWIDDHHKEIVALSLEATKKGWESFTLDARPLNAEVVALELKKVYGFLECRERRGKILVCLNKSALIVRPKRVRNRTKNPIPGDVKSAAQLKAIACNHISDNFETLLKISQNAQGKREKRFTYEPKNMCQQALPYLAKELVESQGYKNAKVNNKKVIVYFEDTPEDGVDFYDNDSKKLKSGESDDDFARQDFIE